MIEDRAAIEAMREPTEAMLDAAETVDGGYGLDVNGRAAREIYRAMIDAALS